MPPNDTGKVIRKLFSSTCTGVPCTSVPAESTIVTDVSQVGWFQTSVGAALNAVLGGNVEVDGHLTYFYIPG